MAKQYRFKELSNLAQIRAVYDYFKGWAETHDENDLTFSQIYAILSNSYDLYYKSGRFKQSI